MIKKILLLLLSIILLFAMYYHELVGYGFMQAKGQLSMIWNVRDVQEVLNDSTYSDTIKAQIRLIEEIKQFGVDSLGLMPSKNYTTFYDQHGKPLIWIITASDRYRIKPYEWHFPIIGTFPYKGYFDSTKAVTDEKILIDAGYDTDIGPVSAWSTLGYLKDPILSSMLDRSPGSLANLILHELTHGTLFVKNNLELNENLASFVGDYGAIRFLKFKYGVDSKQLKDYEFSKKYRDAYSRHMFMGIAQLDSLYTTFGEDTKQDKKKDSLKKAYIYKIMSTTDTLFGGKYRKSVKNSIDSTNLPNNALFISYKTYRSQQNSYKKEFEEKYESNFQKYFFYLKKKYPSL